jgi:hypothetical protein
MPVLRYRNPDAGGAWTVFPLLAPDGNYRVVSTVSDIPAPFAGLMAYETSKKRHLVHDGTEWTRAVPYTKTVRLAPTGAFTNTSGMGNIAWPPAAQGGPLAIPTFEKVATNSKLIVTLHASAYASSVGVTDYYLFVGVQAYFLMRVFYNTTGSHLFHSGGFELTAPAGTLNIYLSSWTQLTGFSVDQSDNLTLSVTESNTL